MSEAAVYLLSNDAVKKYPEEYFLKVCPSALKVADRYRKESDKLHIMAKYVLFDTVLGLKESDIKTEIHGKPYSDKTDKHFSVSHSGDYTILAVSDGNIGADIEKINENRIKVSEYAFTENEKNILKENPAENFFKIWTMKESLSKAVGSGLGMGYKNVDVIPLIENREFKYKGKEYSGESMVVSDYVISVCCEGIIGKIKPVYIE